MAGEHLVTVTIPHVSGLPEDSVVNTFPIDMMPGYDVPTFVADVVTALPRFYNTPNASSQFIARFMGNGLSRAANACAVKLYDVSANLEGRSIADGGIPSGSPIGQGTFTLGNSLNVGSALPEEVAVVLTTRTGNYASQPVERPDGSDTGLAVDRPRQRHSGRIFLGPLIAEAVQLGATNKARPDTAMRTAILDAAERLYDELSADGHKWSVWSRADAVFRDVEVVQVDDAFDTQRRRGVAPSSRTTRTLNP